MQIFRWLKEGLNFTKKNPSILYSLGLILIIPLLLFLNIYWTVNSFQDNINRTLQTKATLIEDIIGEFINDKTSNTKYIQEKINQIQKNNSEIQYLKVYAYQENKFNLIAGSSQKYEGMPVEDAKALAWEHKEGIAHITKRDNQRFWNIIKPFYNKQGEKIGLISLSLSLERADSLIQKTINYSYLILAIILIIVLGLVAQHTRLFEYAVLFKKLKEVDEMKDNFVSMAAHELRAPLSAISGYVTVLRDKLADTLSKEDKEDFSRVIISAKRLDQLVEDILNVSRLEQGRLSFEFKKININPIAKEIVDEFKPKANKAGLQIKTHFEHKAVYINADKRRLQQILTNFISNSIKYTFKGNIDIRVKTQNQKAIIEIEDTGIGMNAKEQKQLFSKFYRIKTKKTADISGTGLGLWITKQLTEKMKGSIEVQSIKGTGSKFTIQFPLSPSFKK